MRKFSVGIAVVIALGAGPAHAQTVPADPARLAAAREVVSVMRVTDTMRGIFPIIWQQMVSPLISREDPRVKAAVDALAPTLMAEMERELSQFGDVVAGLYAQHFTAEELSAIATFMRTPAGQSFIDKQNVLAQASMTAGQQLGQRIFVRLKPRIEEELKQKLGPR